MRLARLAGLDVAKVEMAESMGKRVMLVERFDRLPGGRRRAMVSALTVLGLGEAGARYASNQSAFWDGAALALTPAYDICPCPRSGGEAAQVMAIGEDGWRYSQLPGCVARAATYHLGKGDAQEIVDHQIDVIEANWDDVCDEAGLTKIQRDALMGRQFINPFALLDSHG